MTGFEMLGLIVTIVFSAVAAVQGVTLGRARTSALLVLAASVALVTVANAYRVGLFNGVHLLGALTALWLTYWGLVRGVLGAQPLQTQPLRVRR